jgi:hypothetical protein
MSEKKTTINTMSDDMLWEYISMLSGMVNAINILYSHVDRTEELESIYNKMEAEQMIAIAEEQRREKERNT